MADDVRPEEGSSSGDEVKMTQARFDSIIAERVQQAKRAAVSNLLGELDFESFDSLKQFIQKSKADVKQFEVEKAAWVTEKASMEGAAKSTADELATLKGKAERKEIENAILTEAAKPEYKIATAAIKSIVKLIDFSTVTRDESGAVTGVDAAVKAAIIENPFLVNEATPHGSPRQPQKRSTADDTEGRRPIRKM